MTLRLVRPPADDGTDEEVPPPPLRAAARLDLDLARRTAVVRVLANDPALEDIERGIRAVRTGATPGYFLQVGVSGEPGAFIVMIERLREDPSTPRTPRG